MAIHTHPVTGMRFATSSERPVPSEVEVEVVVEVRKPLELEAWFEQVYALCEKLSAAGRSGARQEVSLAYDPDMTSPWKAVCEFSRTSGTERDAVMRNLLGNLEILLVQRRIDLKKALEVLG